MFVEFCLAVAVLVLVAIAKPWRQGDVFIRGMAAALLGLLGAVMATIFGAAITMTVANVLGPPHPTTAGQTANHQQLFLPLTT